MSHLKDATPEQNDLSHPADMTRNLVTPEAGKRIDLAVVEWSDRGQYITITPDLARRIVALAQEAK